MQFFKALSIALFQLSIILIFGYFFVGYIKELGILQAEENKQDQLMIFIWIIVAVFASYRYSIVMQKYGFIKQEEDKEE